MPMAICPSCDEDVRIMGRPRLGQIISCPRCGSKLEVVSVNPVELDWAFEDDELEEDELDDDDEFEDEDEEGGENGDYFEGDEAEPLGAYGGSDR